MKTADELIQEIDNELLKLSDVEGEFHYYPFRKTLIQLSDHLLKSKLMDNPYYWKKASGYVDVLNDLCNTAVERVQTRLKRIETRPMHHSVEEVTTNLQDNSQSRGFIGAALPEMAEWLVSKIPYGGNHVFQVEKNGGVFRSFYNEVDDDPSNKLESKTDTIFGKYIEEGFSPYIIDPAYETAHSGKYADIMLEAAISMGFKPENNYSITSDVCKLDFILKGIETLGEADIKHGDTFNQHLPGYSRAESERLTFEACVEEIRATVADATIAGDEPMDTVFGVKYSKTNLSDIHHVLLQNGWIEPCDVERFIAVATDLKSEKGKLELRANGNQIREFSYFI